MTWIVFLSDLLQVCCSVAVVLLYFVHDETRSRPADWLISWIIISRSASAATAPLSLFGSVSNNFMQMFSDSPAHYFVFCLSDVRVKNNTAVSHVPNNRLFLGAIMRMMFVFFLWKTFKAKVCEVCQSLRSSLDWMIESWIRATGLVCVILNKFHLSFFSSISTYSTL